MKAHYGKKEGKATDTFYFAFDEYERITSLKMWSSDHERRRCGRPEMSTTFKKLTVDLPAIGDVYHADEGSGILYGVFGRSGCDIDCLGFAMLRSIEHARLTDVQYPGLRNDHIAVSPKAIKKLAYDHSKGTKDQVFTLSGKTTVEESEEWSVTSGLEMTISATTLVDASIPLVADVSMELTASLSTSVTGSYSQRTTKTSKESYQFPVTARAGKHVQATATLYEGVITLSYSGKRIYELDSGEKFGYNATGIYGGVAVSSIQVSVDEL